jgi:pimeloyl-ACP methyl ester carboxylesterase
VHDAAVDPFGAVYEGVAQARPADGDRLERCAVIIGKDDPVAPTEHVLEVLKKLDFPERNIHHLASGGHLPQADDDVHPGWAVRNAHDIARIIESMLLSSREGTPRTTAVESTIMATTETGSTSQTKS